MSTNEIRVFYNSACPVCDAGIKRQKQKRAIKQTQWCDIARNELLPHSKLKNIEYSRKYLHVIDQHDHVHIGIDAFILIWSNTPDEHWKSRVASLPVLHSILKVGYSVFANLLYGVNRLLKNW